MSLPNLEKEVLSENVLKPGLMPVSTIEGMAAARLFETSNAMIAAAYIGKRAKNSREALAALPAMAEMLELAGPALSSIAVKLRNLTATATNTTAVDSYRVMAQDLEECGTEMIRIAIERKPERRKWWQFWT